MFVLDLEFIGESDEARLKKPTRNGQSLKGNVAYNRQLKADAKKAAAKRRKTSTRKKVTGRGAPGKAKSAAHRKAISEGLKRYWKSKSTKRRTRKAGKRTTTRKPKGTTKKRTTRKTPTKPTRVSRRATPASGTNRDLDRELAKLEKEHRARLRKVDSLLKKNKGASKSKLAKLARENGIRASLLTGGNKKPRRRTRRKAKR